MKLSLDRTADPPGGGEQLVQLALEETMPGAEEGGTVDKCQSAELPSSSSRASRTRVYVTNSRPGGCVHTVNPSGGKTTFCGRKFRVSTLIEVSSSPLGPDPDDAKPLRRGSSRREEGMPDPLPRDRIMISGWRR